jgi:hypothetical protein
MKTDRFHWYRFYISVPVRDWVANTGRGGPARSAGQGLAERISELPRFLDEAAVAAREFNCNRAKLLGKAEGGAVRKLAAGTGADADHHTRGRRR